MSEPGGWTAPEGWGPPSPPAPAPPASPVPPPGYGPPPAGYGPPPGGSGMPPYGYGGAPYGPPEVKPGVVPLRPLGLGELLDGAVGVLRRYPRPTLGLAALVAIVSTLCLVALQVTAFRPFLEAGGTGTTFTPGDTEALEEALGGAAVGGALTMVLTLLATAVLTGMLTTVVGKAVLGQPIAFGEAWTSVRRALLPLVGLALLLTLVSALPFLVALVAGVVLIAAGGAVLAVVGVPLILAGAAASVYLYFRLSLAPCALVLERTGIRTGLRRSWLLVKGDWWRVFGISLLAFLVTMFVSLVVQVPFELLGYGSFGDLAQGTGALSPRSLVFSSIGAIVASTLVEPFSAGVRALLYVDRRMRAEGLDVALTAAATSRS
jgi:hypothetical protein